MIVLNARGKPFSWSYSSLTEFESCPYRYAAKRFYCTTVEAETEQTLWGTRVHKAFEQRIRDGVVFSEDFPPNYESWAKALSQLPGEKHFERRFAVRKNFAPCDFFDKDAWGRGVVDLLVLAEDTAVIIDYKTGKKKDDDTQLKIFAWFVANEFDFDRQIKVAKCRYIWLKDNSTTGIELKNLDAKMVMNQMLPRIETMERAWDAGEFPCFPSGLCNGWCPVDECIHYRQRKEWK